MSEWSMIAADAVALLGTAAMTVALVGIVRGRDLQVRIQAASLASVLAVVVVLGTALCTASAALTVRAGLVALLLLLTSPVSSHVLARLAVRLGEE